MKEKKIQVPPVKNWTYIPLRRWDPSIVPPSRPLFALAPHHCMHLPPHSLYSLINSALRASLWWFVPLGSARSLSRSKRLDSPTLLGFHYIRHLENCLAFRLAKQFALFNSKRYFRVHSTEPSEWEPHHSTSIEDIPLGGQGIIVKFFIFVDTWCNP